MLRDEQQNNNKSPTAKNGVDSGEFKQRMFTIGEEATTAIAATQQAGAGADPLKHGHAHDQDYLSKLEEKRNLLRKQKSHSTRRILSKNHSFSRIDSYGSNTSSSVFEQSAVVVILLYCGVIVRRAGKK